MRRNYIRSFLIGISVALFFVFAATLSAADTHVYSGGSIQTAIDSAVAGDTIIVHSGTYYENVVVNKTLTIKAAKSKSRREKRPYVNGDMGTAFYITAPYVIVEGFEAYSYDKDVIAVKADYVTICNNKVRGSGPYITWLDRNPGPGISVIGCKRVNVLKNDIRDMTGMGIWVGHAHQISILDNKIEKTQYEGIGIIWWDNWANLSSNCRVVGNKVKKVGSDLNHPWGGIRVGRNCHDNYIGDNYVSNCNVDGAKGGGMHAHRKSHDNIFYNNKMINNGKDTGGLDAKDMSVAEPGGLGTAGTHNTWIKNYGRTSDPDGLCSKWSWWWPWW